MWKSSASARAEMGTQVSLLLSVTFRKLHTGSHLIGISSRIKGVPLLVMRKTIIIFVLPFYVDDDRSFGFLLTYKPIRTNIHNYIQYHHHCRCSTWAAKKLSPQTKKGIAFWDVYFNCWRWADTVFGIRNYRVIWWFPKRNPSVGDNNT